MCEVLNESGSHYSLHSIFAQRKHAHLQPEPGSCISLWAYTPAKTQSFTFESRSSLIGPLLNPASSTLRRNDPFHPLPLLRLQ